MSTLGIVVVLLVIAVVAVGAAVVLLRGARRRAVADPPRRRPAMGSPAQVWLSRGERVQRELDQALAEHGAWQAVGADAALVISELRITAEQVADLDHAISTISDPDLAPAGRLRAAREQLISKMASAVGELERARAELLELIASASAGPAIFDPDPAGELTSRLAGLRAGLAEVRAVTDPESGSGIDSGGQGHP